MIIAIDESGNFEKNSNKTSLFVAAHIQSVNGSLEIKHKQFTHWENTISSKFRDKKGEIKGQLLGKVELMTFIKNVVYQRPEVRFSSVSIVPRKNKAEIINKHKLIEVKQLQLSLENFRKVNAKKVDINFLDQYSKWVNKRNEEEYLKLLCLKHCLYDSLYNSFVFNISFNMIDELLDIKFKIDKDFISNEDKYWKTYSLRSIQEMTKLKPLLMLKEWAEDHPVRKKYVVSENGFDLNIPFEDNLKFLDSKDNFEIRIVDIAAIVFYRHMNGTGINSHIKSLNRKSTVKDAHIQLQFNDFDFDFEFDKIKKEAF